MTHTVERVRVQEPSNVPNPEPSPRRTSTARIALGWAAALAALAAVGALTVAVLDTDEPATIPVWGGDVKDHPLYDRPAGPTAVPAAPVWSGDVKDHPLYGRSAGPTTADAAPQETPDQPALPEQYIAQRAASERALAELARTEGPTGLSPASLRPITAVAR